MSQPGAPASLRQRVLALRAQSICQGLDDEGLLLLAEELTSVIHPDGAIVSAEGSPSRAMHLVAEGELLLSRQGLSAGTRGPGEAFGALALLARQPSMRAVARGLTRVLEVPALAFEAALSDNQSLMRNTLRLVGQRVLALRNNLPVEPDSSARLEEGHPYTHRRSLVELLIQLRESPFGFMNQEALVDMGRHMREVRYPAGTSLWAIGEPSTHALLVDVGRVRCTAPDGRSVDVGRRFTIGALDVWGTHVRAYRAETVTPLIAFRIDFEDFLSMLETHPEVGLQLLRGFARDVLRTGAAS